ncbi:aldo/keto reductase [Alkalihalobacillus pseudalcaliphilus]|uniref:aldo/keto reductase n=1 Tax=Alkalihalobacillus pseudalcaliphilus TaxID=79884 RepID=UPI00064D94D1|nr:aldo/keto reductase [Alkalihalobacillus pseudalcaliphilus]KMK77765.1 aldo/keto reductase [Alkalihalobacillus pseudalcaliphilus]
MEYRPLGKTGIKVSEVSLGTWAIGGSWGKTSDEQSLDALHYAIEAGVNFFDTADVYGDGHSEELLAKATKGKEEQIYFATKFCRQGNLQARDNYSYDKVREYCEASLKRLGREAIDLYQIHCPPTDILKEGEVFDVLDRLQKEGKIKHYGVSVETVEEGLICLEHPNVQALQVIFNIFRQKPLEQLFPEAEKKGVGILARVPLASGLLTGKFSLDYQFEKDDHRSFNENGEAFNVGETFAGLGFKKGVALSEQLKWIEDGRDSMGQAAIRWVLDQQGITCAIPGFKTKKQVISNLGSAEQKKFSDAELGKLQAFYQDYVEGYIRGPY